MFIHKKILQCMIAWTNLEVIMLREVNQTQKKLHDLIYMRFKKQNQKKIFKYTEIKNNVFQGKEK